MVKLHDQSRFLSSRAPKGTGSLCNDCQARFGLCTYCHVWPAPSISCLGNGVHKLSTDAKVAEFNISTSIQKNIGRFDICKTQMSFNVQVINQTSYILKYFKEKY